MSNVGREARRVKRRTGGVLVPDVANQDAEGLEQLHLHKLVRLVIQQL